MINSSHSLISQASHISSVNSGHWKRVSGVHMLITDNQNQLELKIRADIFRVLQQQELRENDMLSLDMGYFRYTADAAFVAQCRERNGDNDTSFKALIMNAQGAQNQDGIQLQILGVIDIVQTFNVGANTYYIYEFVNKVGSYVQITPQHTFLLGFACTDKNGQMKGQKLTFNNTNYYMNLYIE